MEYHDQPLLTIENCHSEDCGEPPHLTNAGASAYLGYFASEHGDQWLFVYDRAEKRATIRGGDMRWDHPVTITSPTNLPYHFTEAERRWVEACWLAATAAQAARS